MKADKLTAGINKTDKKSGPPVEGTPRPPAAPSVPQSAFFERGWSVGPTLPKSANDKGFNNVRRK